MKTSRKVLAVVVLAAASGAVQAQAQQAQEIPRTRAQPGLCEDIKWSTEMLDKHPGLIDACREVVVSDGRKWARFDAKFVQVDPDGMIQFSVRGNRDRSLEAVLLRPEPGQVAYIDQKPVPFQRLRTSDAISLYMPENQYGFSMAPGQTTVAAIVPAKAVAAESSTATTSFAAVEPMPAQLPRTAGPLPWVALSGILFLLAGLALTLRRYWTGLRALPR